MSNMFDKTTSALQSSINLRGLRHSVTSSNIANAETPGYKAKKLDFEEALRRAVDLEGLVKDQAEHKDHFLMGDGRVGQVRADVYDNPDVNMSNDGNTVDLEREMAELAENTVLYKAALQLINKKLAAMKYVSTEGSR